MTLMDIIRIVEEMLGKAFTKDVSVWTDDDPAHLALVLTLRHGPLGVPDAVGVISMQALSQSIISANVIIGDHIRGMVQEWKPAMLVHADVVECAGDLEGAMSIRRALGVEGA